MSGVVPPLSITKEVLYINREFVNTMIDIYNGKPPIQRKVG